MELGMNHAGEIRRLVEIAEPDVRVWTNVGDAHLEFFGIEDAIADAKAEILERADAGDTARRQCRRRARDGARSTLSRTDVTFGIDAPRRRRAADARRPRSRRDGAPTSARRPATSISQIPLAGRGHLANVLAARRGGDRRSAFRSTTSSARAATLSTGEASRRGPAAWRRRRRRRRHLQLESDRAAQRRSKSSLPIARRGGASQSWARCSSSVTPAERLHRDAAARRPRRRRRQAGHGGRSGGPRTRRGSGGCRDSTRTPSSRRAARGGRSRRSALVGRRSRGRQGIARRTDWSASSSVWWRSAR